MREGRIVAYESPAGLRRISGSPGPLDEVIATLIHPRTMQNLERYFEVKAG